MSLNRSFYGVGIIPSISKVTHMLSHTPLVISGGLYVLYFNRHTTSRMTNHFKTPLLKG
jgi:hypothetical protein